MKIQPVKGTRDFYPEQMAIRSWLYEKMRSVSQSFGYQEYDGPFLETIMLYSAKSGEELVKEQSFVFPDRGGDLVTLRPELTPTLARMVAQRQKELIFPLRWWSFGPFWRYERPQKGRTREFFQWNIDLIGVDTPEADAELIAVIANFFKSVGLTSQQVKVMVNNRKLMDSELARLDIPRESRPEIFKQIDRRDKMSPEEWEAAFDSLGVKPAQLNGIITLLNDSELWKQSPELVRLFEALRAYNVQDYAAFDSNIIRGLDYYTGTVFEAQVISGDIRRAVLGGGRYDNLLADVGGEPLPAVGFAMGDVVMSLVLEQFNLFPENIGRTPAQIMVTAFDATTQPASIALAADLRQKGLDVICSPDLAKLGKQFKYADRLGIRLALVLGPDEIRDNKVTVKNLATGAQQTADRKDMVNLLYEWLDKPLAS